MSQSLRRRAVIILAGGVLVLVLAALGLAGHAAPTHARAPELPRERLSGERTSITSLISGARGRPALVVFWASWCGPCAHEAPALERFARSAGGRGRIVGVDWNDQRSEASAFIRRYRWSFPNARDGEGTVGIAYHLTGLPTTFVLNARGRIAETLRGPQDQRSLARALARAEGS